MLSDKDIRDRLRSDAGVHGGFRIGPFPGDWSDVDPISPDWDKKESPIQPGSIDLHVGHIYVPKSKAESLGSEGRGETSYTLLPGHSVIASTFENISLPGDMGGIVFPPSKLSSNGILVSNIGHIDPGYDGPLRFTIINMGARDFLLERGKVAVGTLMLFGLDTASNAPLRDRLRSGEVRGEPNQEEIDSLAKDFADFGSRIDGLVLKRVRKEQWKFSLLAVILPIMVGVALSYVSIGLVIGQLHASKFTSLEDRFYSLQAQVKVTTQAHAEILRLREEINELSIKIDESPRLINELRRQHGERVDELTNQIDSIAERLQDTTN